MRRLATLALLGTVALPALADAQQRDRLRIPEVELFASVTGKWVLDPERCQDIREDVRDARRNEGRRDRRRERRDQRIVDCPPDAYDFIVEPGQGPKYPVRVADGPIPREYRGKILLDNGDTLNEDGQSANRALREDAPAPVAPVAVAPQPPAPPVYTPPTYTYTSPGYTQPTYTQPSYGQPTYTQPGYQAPAPAPQPQAPSNYEVRDGVIYWLD